MRKDDVSVNRIPLQGRCGEEFEGLLRLVERIGVEMGVCVCADEIMHFLVSGIEKAVRADRVTVMILEPEGGTLKALAATGRDAGPGRERSFRIGEGIAGLAVSRREAIWTDDTSGDVRFLRVGESSMPRRLLSVPILSQEGALGVLNMERTMGNPPFTPDEVWFLKVVASQASVALQNVRLREDAERRLFNLAIVREISNLLLTSRNAGELLEDLVIYTGQVLSADHCVLYEAIKDTRQLEIKAFWGDKPIHPGPVRFGSGTVGWCADRNRSLILNAGSDHEAFDAEVECFPAAHSMMLAPLCSKDVLLGVLMAANTSETRGFTDPDFEMLALLAQQASIALENVWLYTRLEQMAVTDELTGLPNRRSFRNALLREFERSRRHARQLGLMMLDIDHFKEVNDTFGHPVGDVVLRNMGRLLSATVRQVDVPARFGGEEFAIIMPDTEKGHAIQVADRIRSMLSRTDLFEGKVTRSITVSIGIAAYPVDASDPDELIRAADDALYEAKQSGRDRIKVA